MPPAAPIGPRCARSICTRAATHSRGCLPSVSPPAISTSTREALLVAQARDEGIVGFVSVWEPERFVHHLYVAGTRLREGIGAALLRALPGWPAARYRLKCLVRNERALAFYRAHGFVEIDSGVSADGEYRLLGTREAATAARPGKRD
ncbi:acetyltransferase [Burkholderia pseudomallei]|nr:acetyltransferase [Burkholderia pseudomallei]CAJ6592725.1 acetyltransferase [Burkholderia pseudomallei]CAJ9865832.1 acetyltransferase [Burkholderia pseudomallei]